MNAHYHIMADDDAAPSASLSSSASSSSSSSGGASSLLSSSRACLVHRCRFVSWSPCAVRALAFNRSGLRVTTGTTIRVADLVPDRPSRQVTIEGKLAAVTDAVNLVLSAARLPPNHPVTCFPAQPPAKRTHAPHQQRAPSPRRQPQSAAAEPASERRGAKRSAPSDMPQRSSDVRREASSESKEEAKRMDERSDHDSSERGTASAANSPPKKKSNSFFSLIRSLSRSPTQQQPATSSLSSQRQ